MWYPLQDCPFIVAPLRASPVQPWEELPDGAVGVKALAFAGL